MLPLVFVFLRSTVSWSASAVARNRGQPRTLAAPLTRRPLVFLVAVSIMLAACATQSQATASVGPSQPPSAAPGVSAVPNESAAPSSAPSARATPRPTHKPKATPKPTPRPTPKPTPRPTPKPTPRPTPKRTPKPTPSASPKPTGSAQPSPSASPGGVNGNPWGYNFTSGSVIYPPPYSFCSYFACIPTFWKGHGYVVECLDAKYSLEGGSSGACVGDRGVWRPLLKP